MVRSPLRLTAAVAAALLAAPVAAAERTMSWSALDVEARLDARGDLHVRERQAIRFEGDWNGGERRFRIGPGQRLRFEGLSREAAGEAVALARGDLGTVDRWDFTDATTLRWRSRSPSDPPFAGEVLVYVLEYTLERVLTRDAAGGYALSHDLAFPDRAWPIERASGRIALAEGWQAEGAAALEARADVLEPGSGLVVRARLRWTGSGPAPDAVAAPLSPPRALCLGAALAALLAAAAATVVRHARARGQLGPGPGIDDVDEAFLAAHVLAFPPEVVATAWQERAGPAAVAAVLARHCAAGRIEARVEGKVLHLTLRDARGAFGQDEPLVRKLFPEGDTIDTDRLRDHYRGSGFDPAACLRDRVEGRVRDLDGPLARRGTAPLRAAVALVIAGTVAGAVGWMQQPADLDPVWGMVRGLIAPPVVAAVAWGFGAWLGASARHPRWPGAVLAAVLGAWAMAIPWTGTWIGESPWAVAGGVLAWVGALGVAWHLARTRRSADAFLLRRRLAAARAWIARELERPSPRLRDAWMPWVVALDLGGQVDRWFAAAPAAGVGTRAGVDRETGTGSPSGGSASGSWTGGGGIFAGGGASGSWAAFGVAAASYSSPPSSSSDSGSSSSSGSGGSSSGGGGGGGW